VDAKAIQLVRLREHKDLGQYGILSRWDIQRHFVYAEKPVFSHGGRDYAVRTRLLQRVVYLTDYLTHLWRPAAALDAIDEIRSIQDEAQILVPGAKYFVHSVGLYPSLYKDQYDRRYLRAWWRGVVVVT
jgi:hypothetical protein